MFEAVPEALTDIRSSLSSDLGRILIKEFSPLFSADYAAISHAVSIEDFQAALADDRMRAAIHERYPLLENRLRMIVDGWVGASREVMSALQRDLPNLQMEGFVGVGTPIAYVSGLGDLHNGRKSVARVTFDDGTKILFKPRSDDLDRAFSSILRSIGHEDGARVIVPRTLSGGSYHWQEHIEPIELSSLSESAVYYQNMGFLIGVVGLLRGNDIHRENVIAHQTRPVVVDLETLFHTQRLKTPLDDEDLADVVLRMGMLPVQLELDERGVYSNWVGLRSDGGTGAGTPMTLGDTDGDRMTGMPCYRGRAIGYAHHIDDIVHGVREACAAAMARREGVLREIRQLAGTRQRYIYQHTKLYVSILSDLRQPKFFQAQDHVDTYLSGLVPTGASEESRAFARAEREDLLNGDVPMFHAFIGGTSIHHADDRDAVASNALDSLQAVESMFNILDDDMLDRLDFFLRQLLHMATKFEERRPALPGRAEYTALGLPDASPQSAGDSVWDNNVRRALEIYRTRFRDTTHGRNGDLDWIILRPAKLDNSAIQFSRPALDLYSGRMGEAITLALCDRVLGQRSELATAVIASLRTRLECGNSPWDKLGVLTGLGGLVYGHMALSSLDEAESLDTLKDRIAREDVGASIRSDRDLTLAAGTAGLMAALADFYQLEREGWALDLALQCQDKLRASLTDRNDLFGWIKNYPKPLTGLAHGLSGYAVAYSKLYRATDDSRWMEMAERCFAAEDAYFDELAGNWPDFRHKTPPFATSWAHGAPGIGLARLIAVECGAPSEILSSTIVRAVRTTLRHEDFSERGLTTSSLGNAAFLKRFQVSGLKSVEELTLECERYIDRSKRGLLNYLHTLSPEAPLFKGFFSGITGEVYQLCALHWPRQAPAILELKVID